MMANNSSSVAASTDHSIPGALSPFGPPGWSQLVQVSGSNPYYVPNPFVISAGIWLLCCVFDAIWAVLVVRRNRKCKLPITQSLAGWRYRLAVVFAIVAFAWAVFDDTFRLVHEWVEQRLFLAQFVGDFVWDLSRVLLLLAIYQLQFHLMRQAPLGSSTLSRMHFWRYSQVKVVQGSVLVLVAFLMMVLRIAYLSNIVFHSPANGGTDSYQETVESAAAVLCFIFDTLYFVSGLEVLVVAIIFLVQRKRKNGPGKISMLSNNLLLIALPLFLAATFTLISTVIRAPPQTSYNDSFGPASSATSSGIGSNQTFHASLAAVQFTAILLAGVGIVLPLGGIITVARQADASLDHRLQRLTSDSLDQVLVGNGGVVGMRPSRSGGLSMRERERDRERTMVEVAAGEGEGEEGEMQHPLPRPASSNYDDPESWGGSTRRPSEAV